MYFRKLLIEVDEKGKFRWNTEILFTSRFPHFTMLLFKMRNLFR